MKKYTHVECLKDVVEDGIMLCKKGEVYKITGFDYRSLVYYIEPETIEGDWIPDEFAISPIHPDFKFLI